MLSRNQKLAYVSLQATKPLTEAVQSWRQAILKGDVKGMEIAAAELQNRLWKPLQPHLVDAKTVLIAPDGILNQFPFAALPGQRPGSYLLEDLAIGYVTSGRHIVEIFGGKAPRQCSGLLAVGGVDYEAAPDVKPAGPAGGIQIAAKDRPVLSPCRGLNRRHATAANVFRMLSQRAGHTANR